MSADKSWVRSRRATSIEPLPAPVPDEGYRSLNVAEVLADLPSLNATSWSWSSRWRKRASDGP